MKRVSFKCSVELADLIDAWCDAEGITTQDFLYGLVANELEWSEPEPAPRLKAVKTNKRAALVQAAIDAARTRRGDVQ